MYYLRRCGALALAVLSPCGRAADAPVPIPEQPAAVIAKYCLDCHDAETKKGDLNLELKSVDWSAAEQRDRWEEVLYANDRHLMPPPKKPQPSPEERKVLAAWLDSTLLAHTPIGGTLPRRLSREEYQATIRSLFNLSSFRLPVGFPPDTELYGFNNVGEGLVLSPQLLEAYATVATEIADELFPPPRPVPASTIRTAGPADLVLSFSAALVRGDALRLASRSEDVMRSCTWPTRIEITTSGIYRITIDASTFKPQARGLMKGPMILEVRAREISASDRAKTGQFRLLKEITVDSEDPQTTTFEAELYEGQTVMFRWLNAPMTHAPAELSAHIRERFAADPRFLAAWQQAVLGPTGTNLRNLTVLRGGNGWDVVSRHLADPNLDLTQASMDSARSKRVIEAFGDPNQFFNLGDALTYDYFENGPSLELHSVAIEGPLKMIDGPKDTSRQALQARLMGTRTNGQTDDVYMSQILQQLLPRAFRRPVDQETLFSFLRVAKRHWEAGNSFDAGMHLVIRSMLVSPRFLYRCIQPGEMDDHDLATRLAYFLTQAPPDDKLRARAAAGKLSDADVLKAETLRLLPTKPEAAMIRSFTSQWLDTRLLDDIMPAPEFNFSAADTDIARQEIEYCFSEILTKNLPMSTFIDPDFTYTTDAFARRNYGLGKTEAAAKKGKSDPGIQRIALTRGNRHGGLLGQSAIMMATANGVDTQPVLRGVWVLKNILGMPPPRPPKNVPALTPDTQGAKTPRELLAAHTKDPSCARCHSQIDPIGFVLENFDPVGRWRTEWPSNHAPIDSTGTLPDGTPIKDVTDFKTWLVSNIDIFSTCLADKLMIYATGRRPNHAERREIENIVRNNHQNGDGFRDLVTALVQSKTFRTK